MPKHAHRRGGSKVVQLLWTPVTDDTWTLKDRSLAEVFEFAIRTHFARPDFDDGRRADLRNVEQLCREVRMPAQPSVGNVIAWVEWLRKHYAPGTVRNYWLTLRQVFDLASRAGFSRGNPAMPMTVPAPRAKPHPIPNIDAYWPRFLAVCRSEREAGYLGVLFFAGLRKAEGLGLMRPDIHHPRPEYPHGELAVKRQRQASVWTHTATKGRRARIIPIRRPLRELLDQVLALPPARVWIGRGRSPYVHVRADHPRLHETPYLFPFRIGELVDLGERLRVVCPEGFPRGRKMWHAFRDTLAVELWRRGRAVADIRDVLGHASDEVTRNAYLGEIADRVRPDVMAGLDDDGSSSEDREILRAPPRRAPSKSAGTDPVHGDRRGVAGKKYGSTSESVLLQPKGSNPRAHQVSGEKYPLKAEPSFSGRPPRRR